MKQLLPLIIIAISLAGCVSPKYNYTPSMAQINEPPLDTAVTAYVGDVMVRQARYSEHDAIFLHEDVRIGAISTYTFTRGYYLKQGDDEKSEFYLPAGGPESGQVIRGALADPFKVIRLDKATGRLCAVTKYNLEGCTSNANYEKKKYPVTSANSSQQTLIYRGRIGDKINLGYREQSNNVAMPAFNTDLEYDLSESNIIGYKGSRIQVLEANNEFIKYMVIRNFE